jgi:hypothetical protein
VLPPVVDAAVLAVALALETAPLLPPPADDDKRFGIEMLGIEMVGIEMLAMEMDKLEMPRPPPLLAAVAAVVADPVSEADSEADEAADDVADVELL